MGVNRKGTKTQRTAKVQIDVLCVTLGLCVSAVNTPSHKPTPKKTLPQSRVEDCAIGWSGTKDLTNEARNGATNCFDGSFAARSDAATPLRIMENYLMVESDKVTGTALAPEGLHVNSAGF